VLCLALLIVTLDNTVLNVVLPTLVRVLHATSGQLQWIVDAYVLVFAGLLLVAGSLADRIGRKRTFLAGLVLFMAGSTWAAFSGSVGLLIAARASMGIGGALIMPSSLSIVTTMFTDRRERQWAFGIWAAINGVGLSLGPILGGALLTRFWWGSVFLINVPIIAVSLVGSLFLVPDSRNPDAGRPEFIGPVLSAAGLSLLLWSIIEAPVYGWSSALVIGTGLGGVAVLAAFVAWERSSPNPMLNISFFRDRRFSVGISAVAFVMFGGSGALFVLTQYLQFYLGYTPLGAGLRILPAAATITVVAPLSASLIRALGVKIPAFCGLLLIAVGLWQLGGSTADAGYLTALPYVIMLGVGMGLVLPTATSCVMNSLPPAHTGVGSATNSTFLQVGTAMGVAVIGSVQSTHYDDRMNSVLQPYNVPSAVHSAILSSFGGALEVAARIGGTLGAVLAEAAHGAFLDGMDDGLRVAAVVVFFISLVVLIALPSEKPSEKHSERQRPAESAAQAPMA
jgi:EmrB/QacA subfamily drug resistance transporter